MGYAQRKLIRKSLLTRNSENVAILTGLVNALVKQVAEVRSKNIALEARIGDLEVYVQQRSPAATSPTLPPTS